MHALTHSRSALPPNPSLLPRRYNLKALQDRLEDVPAPGVAQTAAPVMPFPMATSNLNPFHQAVTNPMFMVHEFRRQSDSVINHVRNLRSTVMQLKAFKQRFPNPAQTTKPLQEHRAALEQKNSLESKILGDKMKQFNDLMTACRSSPLGRDPAVLSLLDQQRLILYNELEQLHHMMSSPATTVAAAPAGMMSGASIAATLPQHPPPLQVRSSGGGASGSRSHPTPPHGSGRGSTTPHPRHQQPTQQPGRPRNPPNQVTAHNQSHRQRHHHHHAPHMARNHPTPTPNRNSPLNEVSSTTK